MTAVALVTNRTSAATLNVPQDVMDQEKLSALYVYKLCTVTFWIEDLREDWISPTELPL